MQNNHRNAVWIAALFHIQNMAIPNLKIFVIIGLNDGVKCSTATKLLFGIFHLSAISSSDEKLVFLSVRVNDHDN